MSQEQLAALRAAAADDRKLQAALTATTTTEEFVKVAGEYGFPINIEDLPTVEGDQDLSDAELEGVSGGYTFPRTDWVYCDNPWTNYWCTLKC